MLLEQEKQKVSDGSWEKIWRELEDRGRVCDVKCKKLTQTLFSSTQLIAQVFLVEKNLNLQTLNS